MDSERFKLHIRLHIWIRGLDMHPFLSVLLLYVCQAERCRESMPYRDLVLDGLKDLHGAQQVPHLLLHPPPQHTRN